MSCDCQRTVNESHSAHDVEARAYDKIIELNEIIKTGNSLILEGKYYYSSLNRKKLFMLISEIVGNKFIRIN